MVKRISNDDKITNVSFLTNEEYKAIKASFSVINQNKREISEKAIIHNEEPLMDRYYYYDRLALKKIENLKNKNYSAGAEGENVNWGQYLTHIINDCGLKGKVRASDLWNFFTQQKGLRCIYERIREEGWGEPVDYSQTFRRFKENYDNEKIYTKQIAAFFEHNSFRVKKEVGIKVNVASSERPLIRFIDFIISTNHLVYIVECKKTLNEADEDQLAEYEKIMAFVKETKNDHRFYLYFFIIQEEIYYIPKGVYKYDIYSLSDLTRFAKKD